MTRSRYVDVECRGCGATICVDLDATDQTARVSEPEDHEDHCPLAEERDPR